MILNITCMVSKLSMKEGKSLRLETVQSLLEGYKSTVNYLQNFEFCDDGDGERIKKVLHRVCKGGKKSNESVFESCVFRDSGIQPHKIPLSIGFLRSTSYDHYTGRPSSCTHSFCEEA